MRRIAIAITSVLSVPYPYPINQQVIRSEPDYSPDVQGKFLILGTWTKCYFVVRLRVVETLWISGAVNHIFSALKGAKRSRPRI
jgi:hypothetical protein